MTIAFPAIKEVATPAAKPPSSASATPPRTASHSHHKPASKTHAHGARPAGHERKESAAGVALAAAVAAAVVFALLFAVGSRKSDAPATRIAAAEKKPAAPAPAPKIAVTPAAPKEAPAARPVTITPPVAPTTQSVPISTTVVEAPADPATAPPAKPAPPAESSPKRERAGFSQKLDFGTPASPVEPGFIGFAPQVYSAAVGYGWEDITRIEARDREHNGAPLTRDFHFSSNDYNFLVDVPNGEYTVSVHLGDQAAPHDLIDIYAEGVRKAENISTKDNEFRKETFTVAVEDGQLTLRFHDNGGTDGNWCVCGIEVLGVAPKTP